MMTDLSIEVRGREIVVRQQSSGFSVAYRIAEEGLLVADTSRRRDPPPGELAFLADAWRAVYAKAKELGWL
jgi:hypothetical protein